MSTYPDVTQLADMSFALDFQKRGGYMQYVSPEMAAYKPEYKSSPEGYWTWGALVMAAIAYNPNLVSREEAPKTWKDMLDPKWTDAISVKVTDIRIAARRVVHAAAALRQRLLVTSSRR